MCGIAGVFAYSPNAAPVDEAQLLRVRDAMINRGPDGAGLWISPDRRIGLAHRRLAIIDLTETGAQPMATVEGDVRVVFNGEIYNYRELRSRLESKGCRFRSNSDTEVLLHLYREYGRDMFQHLRGMFAFALWDDRRRGMLLARDPFGIKPLYYSDDGSTLRVASQVKALLKGGGIDTSAEPAGHVGFHLWGHVPEPYTFYKGIRALPAGANLWIDGGGKKEWGQFFDVSEEFIKAAQAPMPTSRAEMRDRLNSALADTIRHHLIADVPVGVFLSAGIDSTTIAALAKESGVSELHTVTLGFKEYRNTENDEAPLAAATARHLGASHHTSWITKADFDSEYRDLLDSMDQPSIDGVNSYFVSKAAKEAGLKVVLSGLGGDELFGSYSDFTQIPRMVNAFGRFRSFPGLGRMARSISSPLIRSVTSHKYAGLAEYGGTFGGAYLLRRSLNMPWMLSDLPNREFIGAGIRELDTIRRLDETACGIENVHHKVSALEMKWYMRNQLLRDTDWASMAHSTEIRVPLVDVELFRSVAPLFLSRFPPTKRDLAAAPETPLPEAILERKKTGFSIPVRDWALNEGAGAQRRGLHGWALRVYQEESRGESGTVFKGVPTVIVFRTGQLGDTLVALPAIEAIRRKHPDHRLVLLTNRHRSEPGYVTSWEILGPTRWFDRVIFYDPGAAGRTKLEAVGAVIRELRALGAEHVYNLAPDRSAIQRGRDELFFRFVAGGGTYHSPSPLRRLSKGGNRELARLEPEWRNILRSVDGDETASERFHLPIPESDRRRAQAIARTEGVRLEGRMLAFGPGSKMPAKRWPVGRYAELGARLLSDFSDLRIVVLGGKEDADVGRELCARWGDRSRSLAGKLTPYGSASIMERCAGYVGNDTGTMHLAGISGIPCVAIFSARDNPGKWEPCGSGHQVLRREVECAGCMLESCDKYDNKCLKLVTVDDVHAAVTELLSTSVMKTETL